MKPTLASTRKAVYRFNEEIRRSKVKKRFLYSELLKVWVRYEGRCVFCGLSLNLQEKTSLQAAYFKFYTPPEYGGAVDIDNVVITCEKHAKYSLAKKEIREDIPDIDSFADLIEQLIRGVITVEHQIKTKNPDLYLSVTKVERIKRWINFKLEDIALSMKYKTFKDWEPKSYEVIESDKNSFPDLVQKLTEDTIAAKESEAKEKIVEQTKQIIKTKQYKVIR